MSVMEPAVPPCAPVPGHRRADAEPVALLVAPPRPRRPIRSRAALVRRTLLLADVLAGAVVFGVVFAWGGPLIDDGWSLGHVGVLLGAACLFLVLLEGRGLYVHDDAAVDRTTPDDLSSIFSALTTTAFALAAIGWAVGEAEAFLGAAILAWGAGAVCVPAARAAARIVVRRRPGYVQNTILVGAGDVGQLMARKLLAHPEYGLAPVGFVDAEPKALAPDVAGVPVLGRPEALLDLVQRHGAQRVVFCFSNESDDGSLTLVRHLRDQGVQVDIVPRFFDAVGPHASLNVFEGVRVVTLPARAFTARALLAKRALDIVLASLGLVAAAPLFLAIAVAIRLEDGGPVLFRGRRVGPGGRRFGQLKFRSMREHAPDEFDALLRADPVLWAEFQRTQKLTHDPRVTRTGRLLRRTSLDELPQLWNVLRGDLSLVGPRPLTEAEVLERYADDPCATGYWEVAGLRPGLTGLWQINGRSAMSFAERVRIDTAYLTDWTLMLDLQILAKTPRVLFTSRGAY